jgi:hypothetical protein
VAVEHPEWQAALKCQVCFLILKKSNIPECYLQSYIKQAVEIGRVAVRFGSVKLCTRNQS